LRRLGDLIADKSKLLAEIEVRDNGKLYAEMSAQTAYMAQWYYKCVVSGSVLRDR